MRGEGRKETPFALLEKLISMKKGETEFLESILNRFPDDMITNMTVYCKKQTAKNET